MRASWGLVLALGVGAPHLALGAVCGGGCSGEACASEESVLLQTSANERRGSLPDLGKFADQAREAAKALEGDATAKINDLGGRALVVAGGKLNSTCGEYGRLVREQAARMRELSAKIRSGMRSLIAKAFNISIPGFAPAEGDEEAARDMLKRSASWFGSMATSLEGTSKLAGSLPSQFADVSQKVNTSIQTALQRCRGVAAPLDTVQRLVLQGAGDSLVQSSAASTQRSMTTATVGQVWKVVLAEGGDLAKEDPGAMIGRLNGAVQQARDQLSAFSGSFGDSFASLSASLQDATKGKLSDDAAAKVAEAFDAVASQAKEVAAQAGEAYGGLLESVSDAARDTGVAPSRGPLAAVPGVAPLAAALSVLLYAGM